MQKLEILCNTKVLIFTIFPYTIVIQASLQASNTIVIQASIVTSQIHYYILEVYCVFWKINCLFRWNETEKYCFISLYELCLFELYSIFYSKLLCLHQ